MQAFKKKHALTILLDIQSKVCVSFIWLYLMFLIQFQAAVRELHIAATIFAYTRDKNETGVHQFETMVPKNETGVHSTKLPFFLKALL